MKVNCTAPDDYQLYVSKDRILAAATSIQYSTTHLIFVYGQSLLIFMHHIFDHKNDISTVPLLCLNIRFLMLKTNDSARSGSPHNACIH